MDVSINGTVVGSQGGKNQQMWSPTQSIVNVGGLTTGNLIENVVVCDNVSRIAGYMTNPQNNLNEMASYDKNSASQTYHHGLAQSQDGLNSSNWGVSADGFTLIGYGILSNTATRAIKQTAENGIENLGSLFPEKSTRAKGISADKSVVVGFQDLASGQRAATYWKMGHKRLSITHKEHLLLVKPIVCQQTEKLQLVLLVPTLLYTPKNQVTNLLHTNYLAISIEVAQLT